MKGAPVADIVAAKVPAGHTIFTSRENAKASGFEIVRESDVTDGRGHPRPPKFNLNQTTPAEKSAPKEKS